MYWRPQYVNSATARSTGAAYELTHELVPFVPTHRLRSVVPGYSRKWIQEDYVAYDRAPDSPIGWGLLPATIGSGPADEPPAYAFDPRRGRDGSGMWMSLRPGAGATCNIVAEPVRIRAAAAGAGPGRGADVLGAVYFVRAGDSNAVKIGWSTDVARRIAELQTANAAPLHLLATMAGTMVTERSLHSRFAHARTREDGGEWFDLRAAPDLLVTINTLRGLAGLTPIAIDAE